jgi:hypothetical protein
LPLRSAGHGFTVCAAVIPTIETEPPRLQIDPSGSQLIFKGGHLGRVQDVGKILSFLKSSNAFIEITNYTSIFSLGNLSQDIGERLLKQGKYEFWRNTYSMVWEAWIAFTGLESNDALLSGVQSLEVREDNRFEEYGSFTENI